MAKQWEQMNEQIITLSKRRSQLKQAITRMVQEAYELVEKTPDLDTKLKLIETLRTVTSGKVGRRMMAGSLSRRSVALRRSLWKMNGRD
jgi:26S proteasome regulatory subunit N5